MYKKHIKRGLDIILCSLFIVVFWWLFLIIGVVIAINDGLPIFYTQSRIGYRGKQFRIFKFRTMIKNADKQGPLSTAPGDSRVTPIGKVLRKLSLDELPQLFNILKGDMSIVGNRPDVYSDYNLLNENEKKRLEVVPGLTGLASIRGRSLLTPEERLNCELEYVDNMSFILDLKIIIQTVFVVFTHKGVNSSIGDK